MFPISIGDLNFKAHLNLKSITEEGTLFCIDFTDLCFNVFLSQDCKMFVKNFTPKKLNLLIYYCVGGVLMYMGEIKEEGYIAQ